MEFVQYSLDILANAWAVIGEMAPYLLFGFLMAGILSVFVSPAWVERHLGGKGVAPVAKSVLLGIPLPLCSCGVIPVSASMRSHGAGRGATIGFLLATPQTGVDSIVATWGMLGPVFGIYRPLAALATGLAGGFLEDRLTRAPGGEEAVDEAVAQSCSAECCSGEPGQNRLVRVLRYGFLTLPRDIGKALLAGILVAGLIGALVPKGALEPYIGGGILAMLLMVVVGVPIYVCSTASIPIALGFMHMGASPGAALAFLVAGPATNAATLAMVWNVLGRRSAAIYLGMAAGGALLGGLLLDAVYTGLDRSALAHAADMHQMGAGWLNDVFAVVLLAVIGISLLPSRKSRRRTEETETGTAEEETVTLQVGGMKCSHCSNAVERSLREAEGVRSAEVDLKTGRALVHGVHMEPDKLRAIVVHLGYDAHIAGGLS